MLNIPIALLPVLLFLAVLILMDSFKLVPLRSVIAALLVGCAAALFCSQLNGWLLDATALPLLAFTRYVSPLSEELFKALYPAWLMRRRRVGFLVDGAISGFAVGAGFALVENVYYLMQLGGASAVLWVVRGFGTAIMHGSTSAIFVMVSKALSDRRPQGGLGIFVPGLAAAIVVHSIFNHFLLHPLLGAILMLVVLPLLMIVVFERSQQATHSWLSTGLGDDAELLDTILSGDVSQSRAGAYLHSLKTRFPGTVVADMLCLIRIHLELSLHGKGILIAREAGVHVPIGDDIRANLEELHYLEKAVGKTGLLAIKPLLKESSHDLWHLYRLEKSGARARGPSRPTAS